MNKQQSDKDEVFTKTLFAFAVIIGLVLFCINPFIVVFLWLIWLLVTNVIG